VVEHEGCGIVARAFQHELDHLDGLLFIEKLSFASRRSAAEALRLLEETP
jgi:peptide deformylase